jgi:outer membrane immunogenic protein
MKKLLGGAFALLLVLSTVATAQTGDFKGFYVGFNLGAASQDSNATTSTIFSPTGYFAASSVPAIAKVGTQNPTGTGFAGGVGVGYNFQSRHILLGFETDIGAMYTGGKEINSGVYPCCAPTLFTVTQTVNTNYLYTLRPRVGFTAGRMLVYGTGGLALTQVKYRANFTDTFATAAESGGKTSNKAGWTGGGGAEFKVTQYLSFKAEYLHADFGTVNTTSSNLTAFTPPIPFPTNVFSHAASVKANIGRMGLNARF